MNSTHSRFIWGEDAWLHRTVLWRLRGTSLQCQWHHLLPRGSRALVEWEKQQPEHWEACSALRSWLCIYQDHLFHLPTTLISTRWHTVTWSYLPTNLFSIQLCLSRYFITSWGRDTTFTKHTSTYLPQVAMALATTCCAGKLLWW